MVSNNFSLCINGNNIKINVKNNGVSKKVSIKYYNGYITVVKPTGLSNHKLNKILNENSEKIRSDYIKFSNELKNSSNLFLSRKTILYNGKVYNFCVKEIKENKIYLNITEDTFSVYIASCLEDGEKERLITKFMKDFFKEKTYQFLDEELPYWSNIVGLRYNKYTVRDVNTRWGSCATRSGNLSFSLKLAMLPKDVRGSIIVHELCHLREANHSNNFWKLVYKYFKNYDNCQKWLKDNGSILI